MKKLISAETVRAAHAAGEHALCVSPREHIVTPEARVVAERLGLALTEGDAAAPAANAALLAETPAAPASGTDALAEIRAQVHRPLPARWRPSWWNNWCARPPPSSSTQGPPSNASAPRMCAWAYSTAQAPASR